MELKLPSMNTQPNFEISSKNEKINNFLHCRIISLSIDDHLDTYIDQLSVSFDNRTFSANLFLPTPRAGKDLHLKLGYSPLLKDMGNFYIDSWNVSLPPAILSVTAKSIDLSKKFFNQHTQIWKKNSDDKKTVGYVINEIAKEHQLKVEISERFKNEPIQEYQYVESDIQFLSRLASQYNAFFKVKQNKLFFIEYDDLKNDLNIKPVLKNLNHIILTSSQISNLTIAQEEEENYKSVHAYWYDYEKAEYRLETYPTHNKTLTDNINIKGNLNNEKVFTIRDIFSLQNEAKNAAKAKYRLLARKKQTINIRCIGNPELATGKRLNLTRIQKEIDGYWIIKHINHSLDASGFISSIKAYRFT